MLKRKNNNPILLGLLICVCIALVVTVGGYWVLHRKLSDTDFGKGKGEEQYQYHYAFITENSDDAYWNSVYEAAKEEGKKHQIFVEKIGANVSESYSTEELLQIAIASEVDGILLQSASKEAGEYMTMAMDNNIPVITMLNDNFSGSRQAFVGVNGNDMGKAFAEQIKKAMATGREKIYVLADTNGAVNNNNLIIRGIRKKLSLEEEQLVVKTIGEDGKFGAEEAIRNLILSNGEKPDIIVCLSATATLCVSQSLVDYNKVGKIKVIGAFDSAEIRAAIQKEIILSTVTVAADEIGTRAVRTLVEYRKNGVVNGYQSIPSQVIQK